MGVKQLPDGLVTGRTPQLPGDWKRQATEAKPGRKRHVAVEAHPNGTVRIVVPGPAIGKPRMSQMDKWKKRPEVVRYREWCDLVRSNVGELPEAIQVAALNWTAYFEPPQSWSKRKRCLAIGELHRQKPDASNILKGIEDCLWPDGDQALAHGTYTKLWGWEARLEIEILVQ